MSDAPNEETPALSVDPSMADPFAAIMGFLSPEPVGTEGAEGTGTSATGEPVAGPGTPPTPGEGGDAGDAGAPAPGTDGKLPVPDGEAGAGATSGTAALALGPGQGSVEYSAIQPIFGTISTKLEENALDGYRTEAVDALREEFPQYFEALQMHPRQLVGRQVPSLRDDIDTEQLASSEDAKDWQEGVKAVLSGIMNSRAVELLDENRSSLNVLSGSVDLFRNNPDLVPGTKSFDRALADRVVGFAKPYEQRVNGKLQGWSIPLQALVEQERQVLAAERAKAPAAPAAPKAPAPKAPPPPSGRALPQQGLPSSAGTSSEKEDYSVLFGTLGIPNLRL